jgi:hypothetical protein
MVRLQVEPELTVPAELPLDCICTPIEVMPVRLIPLAVTVQVPELAVIVAPAAPMTLPDWSTRRIAWVRVNDPPLNGTDAATVALVLEPWTFNLSDVTELPG